MKTVDISQVKDGGKFWFYDNEPCYRLGISPNTGFCFYPEYRDWVYIFDVNTGNLSRFTEIGKKVAVQVEDDADIFDE